MAVDISSPALHHAWTTLQDRDSSVEYLVLAYPPGSFATAMSRVSSRSNLRAARSEAAAASVAANSTPPVALDLVGCGSLTPAHRNVPSRTKRSLKSVGGGEEKFEQGLALPLIRELLSVGEIRFVLLRVRLRFLLVQYLSSDLSTLCRARALMHGRSLAAHMTRLDNTVVITDASELTSELVLDSLELTSLEGRSDPRTSSTANGSSQGCAGSATPRHFTVGERCSRASTASPTQSDASSCLSTSVKKSGDTCTTRSSTVPSIDTVPSSASKDCSAPPSIREPRSRQMSEEGSSMGAGDESMSDKRSLATGSMSSLSSTPPLDTTPTLTPPPADEDPEEQARLEQEKDEYLEWLRREEDRLARVEAGKEHRREVIKWQRDETRRKQVLAKLQQEQEQWLQDGTLTLPSMSSSTLMLPIPSDLSLRSPTIPKSPLSSAASSCSRASFQGRRNARPPPLQPPPLQALPPSPSTYAPPSSSSLFFSTKTPTSSSSRSSSSVSPNRASFPSTITGSLQLPRTPTGDVTPRSSSIYSSTATPTTGTSLLTVPAAQQYQRARAVSAAGAYAQDRARTIASSSSRSLSRSPRSSALSLGGSRSRPSSPSPSKMGGIAGGGDTSTKGSMRGRQSSATLRRNLEEQGLHGESWLSRMQRRQSAEGPEWAEERKQVVRREGVDKDLPPVPPIPNVQGLMTEASRRVIEAGRAAQAQLEQSRSEQRRLAFEVSQVERAQRERLELEVRAREKWAREKEDRERLDAFERSKVEHEERKRREAAERLQQEEELRASNARAQKQRFANEEAEALEFLRRQQREADEREARLRTEAEKARRGREEAEARTEKRRMLREKLVEKLRGKAERGEAMVQGVYDVHIDSKPWRSRWLSISIDDLSLYNPEDKARTPPTERTALLRGNSTIQAIEEPPFEELQMPNSLRVTLILPLEQGTDGRRTRTYEISARTAADKLKLLTALQIVASSD